MKPSLETDHPIFDFDLYLIGDGNHFKSYEKFGAQVVEIQGVRGVYFALWAPNARSISLWEQIFFI